MVQKALRYVKPFTYEDHVCDRQMGMDGQMDRQTDKSHVVLNAEHVHYAIQRKQLVIKLKSDSVYGWYMRDDFMPSRTIMFCGDIRTKMVKREVCLLTWQ